MEGVLMDVQETINQAIERKLAMDEAILEARDPNLYDLRVNGIRHVPINYDQSNHTIWDITPTGMKLKYEKSILDVRG